MNANMAALNMVRKPKVEIEEVMYPEDLAAQEQMAQPPIQESPMEQMGEVEPNMPPMTPEEMEMMKRKQMMG